MLKRLLLSGAALLMSMQVSQATVMFSDSFESDAYGLNYPRDGQSLTKWTVPAGTIDVIGGSYYGLYGPGHYVDMDGSSLEAGTLKTRQTFNLLANHRYKLSFDYGKNGANAEGVNFSLGSLLGTLLVASGSMPAMTAFSHTFNASNAESGAFLSIIGLGNDNQGLILDNIMLQDMGTNISPVPLPAGAPLLLAGLIGLGVMARRKKSMPGHSVA